MTKTMRSINPATGDTLAEHPMLSAQELERLGEGNLCPPSD